MFRKTALFIFSLILLALSACATIPAGPGIMVAPAPGKPFELFKQEDASCRRWAEQQIGFSPQEAISNDTAAGAIAGTALGAGLGALVGSASGHAGAGALIGGVGGMIVGAASGADSGRVYGREAQHRYDSAYMQCMYANGNQILGNGRGVRRGYRTRVLAPPPPMVIQPPLHEPIPPPPPPPGASHQIPPDMLPPPVTLSPSDRPIPPPPYGARPETPPEMMGK
ncbi:MAG: hypothetical protein WCP20_06765 [Desulfuromonadales bacterium]